jgi:hypothetical protein
VQLCISSPTWRGGIAPQPGHHSADSCLSSAISIEIASFKINQTKAVHCSGMDRFLFPSMHGMQSSKAITFPRSVSAFLNTLETRGLNDGVPYSAKFIYQKTPSHQFQWPSTSDEFMKIAATIKVKQAINDDDASLTPLFDKIPSLPAPQIQYALRLARHPNPASPSFESNLSHWRWPAPVKHAPSSVQP